MRIYLILFSLAFSSPAFACLDLSTATDFALIHIEREITYGVISTGEGNIYSDLAAELSPDGDSSYSAAFYFQEGYSTGKLTLSVHCDGTVSTQRFNRHID